MKASRGFVVLAGVVAGLAANAALAQIGPIVYATANGPLDSADFKQVTATCPPGTIAFSGGASITDGETLQLLMHQSLPLGNPPSSWLSVAQERVPTAANWRLTSHAVCAAVPGYELVEDNSPFDSSSLKDVVAPCPPGKVPIGGGGGIFFFNPQLALFAFAPTSTGFEVSARESTPYAGNWSINVKVSCAPAVDVLRVSASTDNAVETRDVLELVCPLPRVLIGGGTRVTPGEAIYASHPVSNFGWEVGGRRLSANPWVLGGSALCLSPSLFADGFESGDTGGWSGTGP